VFCLSYPSDALVDDIDALISGADSLSAAASSVGSISSGSDVLVSNFAHVEEVFQNLQAFLSELKDGHYYTPVGSLMPFAGTSAYVPSGWIMCYGQAYNASGAGIGPASADLQTILNAASFSAIPDLRGRVIAGIDNMGGTDAARLSLANTPGTAGGAETLPEHTHPVPAWATTDGAGNHTHGVSHTDQVYDGTGPGVWPEGNNGVNGYGPGNQGHSVTTAGAHNHTIPATTTSPTGTGTHGVVQPTIVLNYIIKN
jgi:microcystin-dependent protein